MWSSTIRGEQDLQPHLDVRTLSAPPKDGGGRGGELKRELKWSAIYVIALVLKHYQPITSFLREKEGCRFTIDFLKIVLLFNLMMIQPKENRWPRIW